MWSRSCRSARCACGSSRAATRRRAPRARRSPRRCRRAGRGTARRSRRRGGRRSSRASSSRCTSQSSRTRSGSNGCSAAGVLRTVTIRLAGEDEVDLLVVDAVLVGHGDGHERQRRGRSRRGSRPTAGRRPRRTPAAGARRSASGRMSSGTCFRSSFSSGSSRSIQAVPAMRRGYCATRSARPLRFRLRGAGP